MQIQIDYRFTTLNEYISAERTNRHIAANIKRRETEIARLAALGNRTLKAYPLDVTFQWFCKSKRTDPDNIAFAQKFIFDGFVLAGILEDDKWKHIASIKHEFNVSNYDYVIVDME